MPKQQLLRMWNGGKAHLVYGTRSGRRIRFKQQALCGTLVGGHTGKMYNWEEAPSGTETCGSCSRVLASRPG